MIVIRKVAAMQNVLLMENFFKSFFPMSLLMKSLMIRLILRLIALKRVVPMGTRKILKNATQRTAMMGLKIGMLGDRSNIAEYHFMDNIYSVG